MKSFSVVQNEFLVQNAVKALIHLVMTCSWDCSICSGKSGHRFININIIKNDSTGYKRVCHILPFCATLLYLCASLKFCLSSSKQRLPGYRGFAGTDGSPTKTA